MAYLLIPSLPPGFLTLYPVPGFSELSCICMQLCLAMCLAQIHGIFSLLSPPPICSSRLFYFLRYNI